MRATLITVLLLLGAFSVSCGGDAGSGADGGPNALTCNSAACGGDPVGVWTISATCFDFTGVDWTNGFCPAATIMGDITITGTMSFNADNTYDSSTFGDGQFSYSFPGSCLVGLTDCAQLEGPNVTCTGSPVTSCACMQTIMSDPTMPDTQTGTWASSGNTLSVTTGGTTISNDYCVQGNSAVITAAATATTAGTSIVLSK